LLLVRRAKTTSFDIYGIEVPDGCGDLELAVHEQSCERRGHGGTRAELDTSEWPTTSVQAVRTSRVTHAAVG
jgi:hypothetical protein